MLLIVPDAPPALVSVTEPMSDSPTRGSSDGTEVGWTSRFDVMPLHARSTVAFGLPGSSLLIESWPTNLVVALGEHVMPTCSLEPAGSLCWPMLPLEILNTP